MENPFFIYLSVTEKALSSVLIKEEKKQRKPVYYISKALQGVEVKYQKIEKLAFALIVSARRLRPYFQGHRIIVMTKHPIWQVLRKLGLVRRMIAWSVELSKFNLEYRPRGLIKAQVLTNFIVELSPPITNEEEKRKWTLYVDGSSNNKGSLAGVTLEDRNRRRFSACDRSS